ncbi:MAG TPA: hypothetical protein VFZ58_04615 [Candidatus Saccharimonadales bacterium]
MSATEMVYVAPILSKHIVPSRNKLSIVESPSVGTLAVPADIGEFIGFALKTMLDISRQRSPEKVRIVCTVDHRQNLMFEMTDDDPSEPDAISQGMYCTIIEHATYERRRGGGVAAHFEGREDGISLRLMLPLASH